MSVSLHSTDEIDQTEKVNRLKTFLKEKVLPLVFKQFMTIGILIALFVGFVFPRLGNWVSSFEGSTYICVIIIFLHSGLKLKTAAMKDAIKEWKAFIWGLISITLITTLIGTKLTQLLPFGENVAHYKQDGGNQTLRERKDSVVGPGEFLLGLELYYISPCAVASGIVLISLAGGDVTLGLLLTVITNIFGVVSVPLLAAWLVSVENVKINAVSLLIKLVSTVLVPLIVGKAMTRANAVREFVHNHTKTLKIISISFLVCIPWMKISKAKLAGSIEVVSVLNLFIVFLWGFALHLVMLMVNYIAAWLIRVNLAIRKTLVILASTKTLAITLSVISFLPPEIGDGGLMSLPLIVLHLALLLIDSMWVVHWNTNASNEEENHLEDNMDVDTLTRPITNGINDSSTNHETAV